MRVILIMLLFFTLSVLGYSQSNMPKNELLIGLGGSHNLIKDPNFAPFQFEGSGAGVRLAYQRRTATNDLFLINTNAFVTNVQSDFSDFTQTANINLNLQLTYLVHLNRPTSKLNILIGGSLRTHIDLLNYSGYEALSYFNLHSVNLNTQMSLEATTKSYFFLDIDLPLFGVLVRPPYAGWEHTINTTSTWDLLYNGPIKPIGKFVAWNIQLAYQYDISPKFALQFQLAHNYKLTKQGNGVAATSNIFSTILHYKF